VIARESVRGADDGWAWSPSIPLQTINHLLNAHHLSTKALLALHLQGPERETDRAFYPRTWLPFRASHLLVPNEMMPPYSALGNGVVSAGLRASHAGGSITEPVPASRPRRTSSTTARWRQGSPCSTRPHRALTPPVTEVRAFAAPCRAPGPSDRKGFCFAGDPATINAALEACERYLEWCGRDGAGRGPFRLGGHLLPALLEPGSAAGEQGCNPSPTGTQGCGHDGCAFLPWQRTRPAVAMMGSWRGGRRRCWRRWAAWMVRRRAEAWGSSG
jgi:hypothetical protein